MSKPSLALAAAGLLLTAATALAQSITPMSNWVPGIDRAAAAARAHQLSELPAQGAAAANHMGDAPAGR